jgi:hypothetical protein
MLRKNLTDEDYLELHGLSNDSLLTEELARKNSEKPPEEQQKNEEDDWDIDVYLVVP